MSDIFVSYSRKDAEFVRELQTALDGRGKEVWVDWQDIPPTAEWIEEIKDAIEKAESFAFVITPHSLGSEICRIELDHAQAHNKRIVPLALRADGEHEMPDVLQRLNWIVIEDEREIGEPVDKLVHAIETDLDWVREHTRLTTRAVEWQKERERAGYLLSGEDLERAERQLEAGQGKEPSPTALQTRYVGASRRAATGRQRKILIATLAALVLSIGLGAAAVVQRNRAQEAARLAEAQKLLALGQLELEDFPTGTLAHAIKSLELTDTLEGRLLALEALWKGPPAWHLPGIGNGLSAKFSPDGRHLVQMVFTEPGKPVAHLVRSDGTWQALEGFDTGSAAGGYWVNNDLLLTWNPFHERGSFWTLFSVPDGKPLKSAITQRGDIAGRFDPERERLVIWLNDGRILSTGMAEGETPREHGRLRANPEGLGRLGRQVATLDGGSISLVEVSDEGLGTPRVIGQHPGATKLHFSSEAGLLVSRDHSGEVRIWSVGDDSSATSSPARVVQGPAGRSVQSTLDPTGTLLHLAVPRDPGPPDHWVLSVPDGYFRFLGPHALTDEPALDATRSLVGLPDVTGVAMLSDLSAPDGIRARPLYSGFIFEIHHMTFDPKADWLASPIGGPYFFHVSRRFPIVLMDSAQVAFDPGGRALYSSDLHDVGRLSLEGSVPAPRQTVYTKPSGSISNLIVSRDGRHLFVGKNRNHGDRGPILVSIEDGTAHDLPDDFKDQTVGLGFSPDGRYAAAVGGQFVRTENVIKVWDVESRQLVGTQDPDHQIDVDAANFTYDNDVVWAGRDGLMRWDLESGTVDRVVTGDIGLARVSGDGRTALVRLRSGETALMSVDLETGVATPITTHGAPRQVAISDDGRAIASLGMDSTLRIGPITGEEPHIYQTTIEFPNALRIDPQGRWVAIPSRGGETTLWPMPDVSQTPMHRLPLDELLERLRSLTNCRLQEDSTSSTGWSIGWETYPGWETVPDW